MRKKFIKNTMLFIMLLFYSFSEGQTLNVDLSTYVRVGRYDLPEPTRTAHPTNSLLAQEASAVTYNWDTNTLFVVGDGSTSIVQISKTGQLIDSMTLSQGSSPQGTEFYDTEGLTYIGNGQFVMTEERDRQVVKFTYVAGSTLTRANTQTVKLGTFVNNIGTEGISYDPLTNGYIALKEITPIGVFQTGIDFAAGTATNGSATTENSVNLFDPALLGVSDVADIFALSNIPSLIGLSLYNNLLVLSQENAKVVNIDRNGVISSSLTIVSDAGNPLDVASQQHEGLTMDRDGNLYIVSENGGGDIDHPQLWVYAPSIVTNQAPTTIALTNSTNAILENTVTTPAVKVADIAVTDDGLGTNNLTLSGTDANFFQITGSSLYIKPGTVLDYETKTSYSVTVNVDDTTIGNTPDASVNFVLAVTDVLVETTPIAAVSVTEVAPWSSSTTNVAADWFEVTNNGTTALDITGWKVDDNSNLFTAALALTGITSIAAGESVIFLETSSTNAATIIANFKTAWFGSNVPAGLQVGSYTGSGIGLSTGGDAVNLYDATGVLKANVTFGVSTTNYTFNNAAAVNNSAISTLSQVGVNGALAAINDTNQIGSPGTVGKLFISEVAPWSSGNSPVGADWFEVTNTKAVAVDITGWKMDDNSQSPAAAVALSGITSINPGESVIFMETSDLTGKTTAFLNNWFGTNPSSGLRIGNYTGSGVGLSSGGDQVNLYNTTSSTPQASVLFGASPANAPYTTFDNSNGINAITTAITQFSAVGTKGAFIAANSATEIGSPGTIKTAPCPTITATATPAATSVCKGATTTVSVTATGGTLPYIVTGSPLTVGGGTFNYTITDAKGCTATASVIIVEQPLSNNTTTIAANNSYVWSVTGETYTTSGIKTGTTTNCVTELLDLTITKTLFTAPSTAVGPYVLPVATGVTTTSMLTVPETVGGYKMAGIPDGLGAFDNNNGTFTLLMNHEIGNTLGTTRAHGAIGSFVSKWIVNKSDLSIASGSDLMTSVYGWNSSTQSSNASTSAFAFTRFCSADLPAVNAFYNPFSGLGTQSRIFMHGEEGGTTGYQVATVASGVNAGKAYILGKFNISTNGSGLTGVGAWENALANPFPQDKTVVVGNNDGGTGIMNNSVCVYQGTKTNTGTEVDKAGLTNGTLKFVNVTGNTLEIPTANATSRATNITSGTTFTLSATSSTTFSRPEDGAWDPADVNKYYFVTTDRLDQVNDGIGSQIGRSRLWRLNFADITNPDLGGTIDLLLDGTEGQVMMDNMTFDKYGHILLLEDVGGAAHNGKVWQYTIATDQIKMLAKHDPAKFGDIVGGVTQNATLPFNNDEETSGIIDMSDILGAGNFLVVDQAHYNVGDTEAVEGGQLLKLYNPDTFTAAQCATASNETVSSNNSYTWNGKTYTNSGIYTNTSTNVAGCFHTATLNLTITKTLFTAPTTAVGPYILPVATGVTATSMLTVPETVGGYKMAGIPDGLGAFDNNNGTFTLLMNHEIGNTLGTTRAHGAIGSFVSKWIVNKSDLSIASGSDLMTSVYGWNSSTQSSNASTSAFAFTRFCSADLPAVNAFYNPFSGLGTQSRIFMHGEEGGTTGYQVATVASGVNAGKAYILGKFNISTNGSGLTGVGAWENALANPFPQDKTVVVGNNDGGTGIMNNSVCVYQGTKTNTGSEVDKAGLTNGTLKFVNVTGNTLEIPTANTTSRATNITSGTAFTLSATSSTTFSRPEDGAWDPADVSKYYFVTTDRLDQVNDGIGSQIGRSRLWRLNFADITNPDLGGTIDLLLDGTEGQVMMDNMTFDKYGHILLLEDVGGAAHNGKVWQYTIATDQIKMLAKHDPAKFGDIVGGVTQNATLPFNNDEETSGIIDMSDILGAGNFLVVDQAHYNVGDTEAVEGGQLLKLYNPDTFTAAQCATASNETITNCGSYVWNGKTYDKSGIYTKTSTNVAGCFHTSTLNLTIVPAPKAGTNGTLSIEIGKTPTEAQLFASLTGADLGGTWSNSGLVYTYTVAGASPCTDVTSTVTVTNVIPTTMSFCQGAKVSNAVGFTTVKFYTAATGGSPLAGTTALTTKTLYATQTVNGNEILPRVAVSITVNALPTEVLGTITSNTPTDTGFADAILAVGPYVGKTTTVSYRLPALVDTSLSYNWTVPAGVSIVGQAEGVTSITQTGADANVLNVNFSGVASGIGTIGVIKVQAQNNSGCIGTAKSITVSKILPTAPTAIIMTDDTLPLPSSGIASAITNFSAYIGTSKVLTLTATPVVGATSYEWELPTGVNQLTGGNSNVITVDFAGVTKLNTYSYDVVNATTAVVTPINVLRIGVKAINGVGTSITANTTAANPTTISTARLLTLKAILPTAPAAIKMTNDAVSTATAVTVISKFIGTDTPLTLTATPSANASSYDWELPAGVNQLSGGASNVITVNFADVAPGTSSLYIGVKAVNGLGSLVIDNGTLVPSTTSTAKLLKLTSSIPTTPSTLKLTDDSISSINAVTVVSKYIGTTTPLTLTATASLLANSYEWELPAGVNQLTGGNSNVITVNFAGVNPIVNSFYIGVKAVNGVGSSVIANPSTLLPVTTSTARLLKVYVALPAAVTTVAGQIASVCPGTSQSYTITAPIGATQYVITAPLGSVVTAPSALSNSKNVLTTSDLNFTVSYASSATFVSPNNKLTIVSKNLVGLCSVVKTLTLTKGTSCSPVSRITSEVSVDEEFSVLAYPNPSDTVFTIDVVSSNKEKSTEVLVYDMTGRLIEQRQVQSDTVQLGSNYATGVYNVFVKQDANVKTLRLIKK